MISNILHLYNSKLDGTKSIKTDHSRNRCFGSSLNVDTFIKSSPVNVSNITKPTAALSFKGLSNKEEVVLNKLNDQLMDVSVDDIEKIVNAYPDEDRGLALNILKRATQYGNMDSLNSLYDSIIEKKKMVMDVLLLQCQK